MKKALILSTALVLLASPAMATSWKHGNQGGDANASSTASAAASADASAGVYGSGNSHNVNKANQDQAQGQHQGQGQSQNNRVNNSDSVTVKGDDVDQEYYNINTPSSAGNNVADCTKSLNGSINGPLAGISWGIPLTDQICKLGKLLEMARSTSKPHLIAMAEQALRDYLQEEIGYKATVLAIKDSEPIGKQVVHRAKPYWCDRVSAGSTQSDRKACGLE